MNYKKKMLERASFFMYIDHLQVDFLINQDDHCIYVKKRNWNV